jgi:hypothetical protein
VVKEHKDQQDLTLMEHQVIEDIKEEHKDHKVVKDHKEVQEDQDLKVIKDQQDQTQQDLKVIKDI